MKCEPQEEPRQGMLSPENSRLQVIGKMINNQTFRNPLEQSLLDTSSVQKGIARDAMFDLLKYKDVLRRSIASSARAVERKQKENRVAPGRLSHKGRGG